MSKKRQEGRPLVRTYALTHPPGLHIPARATEGWDQLAHAVRGVMSIDTPAGRWVIPPRRAVWIPSGTRHSILVNGRVTMRSLFFRDTLTRRRMPRQCVAVDVVPLVRELILEANRIGALYNETPREARLARVLLDQLEVLPALPLRLPLPDDPRARAAADHIAAAPGRSTAIGDAAREAGLTRRTLERLFARETKMTLGNWRKQARLIQSLQLLAEGAPVTEVALEVGYSSASAFIAAFKAALGYTPSRYFDRADDRT